MSDLYVSPPHAARPVTIDVDGGLFVGDFWLRRERPPESAVTPIGAVSGIGGARVERFRVNGTGDVIRRVTVGEKAYWDVAPETGGGQSRGPRRRRNVSR